MGGRRWRKESHAKRKWLRWEVWGREINDMLQPDKPRTKSSPVLAGVGECFWCMLSGRPQLFTKSLSLPSLSWSNSCSWSRQQWWWKVLPFIPSGLLPTLHPCSREGNLCLFLAVWHLIDSPWSGLQDPPPPLMCEVARGRGWRHRSTWQDLRTPWQCLQSSFGSAPNPCSPPGIRLSFLTPLPHLLCSPGATCRSQKWRDRAWGKGENTVCVSENVKRTLLHTLFLSWYSSLSPAELLWPIALKILLHKCSGDKEKAKEREGKWLLHC